MPSDAERYMEQLRASGMLSPGLISPQQERLGLSPAQVGGLLEELQRDWGAPQARQTAELQRARALWEEDFTGDLNYGPDDPRIQPALVPGQYEMVGPGGKREMVGQPRQGRTRTFGRQREAMSEALRRGDKWVDQPPITLEQIKAGLEAGVITWVEAQELLKLVK